MLEAGIQMWFKTELSDDMVMMTVDMCVDAV